MFRRSVKEQFVILISVFMLTAGAGCASVETSKSADDLSFLKKQVWTLQKQTAELGLKVSEISNEMAMLSERMKSIAEKSESEKKGSEKSSTRTTPDVFAEKRPIVATKPVVKEKDNQVSKTDNHPVVNAKPEKAFVKPKSAHIVLVSGNKQVPVGESFKGLDEVKMYKRSMDLFNGGEFSQAGASFSFFIRRYPGSTFASSAQYWLGEVYYSQKNYGRAAVEFKRALIRYPKGLKNSDAMLKMAFCKIRLNQFPVGKAMLKDVISRYPLSVAASTARRELAKVNNNEIRAKSGDS